MSVLKALGLKMRAEVELPASGGGLAARDGRPVMARTDPATGRSPGFAARGFDGRGTPDEKLARRLRRRR